MPTPRADLDFSPFFATEENASSPPPMPPENNTSPRQFALMVSEEEAEALMHVLLLAPMEGGAFGAATDRLLSRLAELQRAFGRDENL